MLILSNCLPEFLNIHISGYNNVIFGKVDRFIMGLRKILNDIYDETTDDLIESNRDAFKDKLGIEKAMIKYTNHRASKCQLCEDPEHQEFPGWIGALKYNKNGKIENKDIIIFGLEPTTNENTKNVLIKKYGFKRKYNLDFSFIHIWYELGYDTFDYDLMDNKRYGNRLFEYLSIFFNPLSEYIVRFYGTDLAKCYTKNNPESRKICSKEFLLRELRCFATNQMIFIIQGRESKQDLEQFFEFSKDTNFHTFLQKNHELFLELGITYNHRIDSYSFEIGSFSPLDVGKIDLSGKYLLIPHSSPRSSWNEIFDNQEKRLLKKVIEKIKNYLSLKK